MIILRVAMGRGFLKETVKEMDTTLAFAKPATLTVDQKYRGVRMTVHEMEGSAYGPGTAGTTEASSAGGTSVKEHMGTVGGDAC